LGKEDTEDLITMSQHVSGVEVYVTLLLPEREEGSVRTLVKMDAAAREGPESWQKTKLSYSKHVQAEFERIGMNAAGRKRNSRVIAAVWRLQKASGERKQQ